MRHLLLVALALSGLTGCNAISRGTRLSNVPMDSQQFFLSTGSAHRKYRTVGFVQIRGYGVEIGGFADVGEANLDGAIKGYLTKEARRLGGTGVIHIEFDDENPTTDVERASAAANSVTNLMSGKGPETKERYVTVTGEVIQFLE